MARQRWRLILAVATLLLVSGAIAANVALRHPFTSEWVRGKVVAFLSDRLDAEVELESIVITVLPNFHVKGGRLAVRHKGRHDVPPLIAMDGFSVDGTLPQVWRRHVSRVVVNGLDIQIPPKEQRSPWKRKHTGASSRDFVVDELVADSATLTILRKDEAKNPRVWQMHELRLQKVGVKQAMPFQSVLTNGVPPGKIVTQGSFGPWGVDEPGQTPLDGTFTFDNANLGVFKGISGILSSRGQFKGVLDTIDVHGQTDTPDFMLQISGHPVPLKTTYHAVVDGTNGNTTLSEVNATFLNTSLVAKGGVYHTKGVKGRTVSLDVSMPVARLEDIMRLAVKSDVPPMTGSLSLTTKFEIPPGDDRDVAQKLELDGRFTIGAGKFTDRTVQRKIVELSRRATVEKDDGSAVASDFSGRFKLAGGVLSLPTVAFAVPGAAVQLSGRYALQPETISFAGNLFMDAKISQMTTGWKSVVLKLVDPLFRKNGETVIPIKIQGTRDNPSYGLDKGRILNQDDVERPRISVAPQ